ncbi:hypothetical protein FD754_021750 [Muntiacus muntjak]|uniref:Uncharacterized protein n=1 Tax=Muntiacus muntjak TaxID=9888 RepID=A0A5N3V6M7_MUNMU|nr:hypothetical protein FD754_021750 [Muntiacus muntjak]
MTVFFKTLRNHWKKTTAGICLLTWGGHWVYGKHWSAGRRKCQDFLWRSTHSRPSWLSAGEPPPR